MSLTFAALRQEWIIAGGPPKEADTAAAVAEAESGGNNHAVNHSDPFGGSYCAFQINGVHPFNAHSLTEDPYLCALAATYVRHKQGWNAWSTHRSGKYKAFLPHRGNRHTRRASYQGHAKILHQYSSHVAHPPNQADFSPLGAVNHVALCFLFALVFFCLYGLACRIQRLFMAAIREDIAVHRRAFRRRRHQEEIALRNQRIPKHRPRIIAVHVG